MSHFDYLIIGSGLFGAVFAHQAKKAGKSSLVIDRRPHTGGNIYCEEIEGIHVHKYGAHIFHTSNKRVWDYVNAIVPFNRYTNSPVANYQGRLYNLPFNMNTFYQIWGVTTPEQARQRIEVEREDMRRRLEAEGVTEPRNLEEQAQLLIGHTIYERLIKGYTEKQWGRRCTALPAFIIKRLPVRFVFDNNYFNDKYQGIPIGGYNKLTDGLLEGLEVMTGIDFFDCRHRYDAQRQLHTLEGDGLSVTGITLVYTGQLDEYFDFRLGKLNYRTVHFDTEVMNTPNYQGNAVVNYTEAEVPYTRIIEHKHFEDFGEEVYKNQKTVISREYSTEWQSGMEPYYPVNDERNDALAAEYRRLAAAEPATVFGGRLAEYRYYDMAPLIEKVLRMWEERI